MLEGYGADLGLVLGDYDYDKDALCEFAFACTLDRVRVILIRLEGKRVLT